MPNDFAQNRASHERTSGANFGRLRGGVVDNWVKRYSAGGIKGLQTRPGRGRKAILQTRDLAAVAEALKKKPPTDFARSCGTGNGFGARQVQSFNAQTFSEKNECRYKRIRKRLKGKPAAGVYRLRKELLGEYEQLSESGLIGLYYGDESGVSLQPAVPYGWQFADEEVSSPSENGNAINRFGLFTRSNAAWTATSEKAIGCRFCGRAIGAVFVFALEIDGGCFR